MNRETPEGGIKALLIEKGMQEHEAGTLAFDLVWDSNVIEVEDAFREALARRARTIRAAATAGLSYRQLADITGLSYQRIAQIVTGGDDV